mgnify:FL=1
MSTIKVDTIATRTGSGNITLNNNVASLTSSGAISGTTISATASGAPLTVNSTNSNTNKVIFQNNGSAVSHLGGLSNGVVFGNAAGTQIGRLDGDGLKFGTDTAAANALDDYEEGTYTPTFTGFTGSGGTIAGYYTKIGNLCNVTAVYQGFSWTSGGSQLAISLPFSGTSSGRQFANGGLAWYYIINSGSTYAYPNFYINSSSNSLVFYWSYVNGGTWQNMNTNGSNGSSGYLEMTVSYKTA